MNFKIVCLILAFAITINEANCKEETSHSRLRDAYRDEFSFSSLKKELKYKYYLAMKQENQAKSPVMKILQPEEQRRVKALKNIFNIVKNSIII